MTTLTARMARSYVEAFNRAAGIDMPVYSASEPYLHESGVEVVSVHTQAQTWDVWVENGRLYGEF